MGLDLENLNLFGVEYEFCKDKLAGKADAVGEHDSFIAGTAKQLLSKTGVTDTEPYKLRASRAIGDRAFDTLVGGSVAWNQLLSNTDDYTGTANQNNTLTFGPVDCAVNHKYLCSYEQKTTLSSNTRNIAFLQFSDNTRVYLENAGENNNLAKGFYAGVLNCTVSGSALFRVWCHTPNTDCVYGNYNVIDLTTLFGSTIADYIYSLEQATAGAGVAWVRKYLTADYYAYCAPKLEHVTGVSAHVMTGFNQWDEEWEVGGIDNTTGANTTASDRIRSKNYIPVLPSTTYFFKSTNTLGLRLYDANKSFMDSTAQTNTTYVIPENVRFIRFICLNTTTYNHDICINLSNASRNGEYEPYEEHSYPIDSAWTGMGIPKLDSSNKLYFDGDRYASDGTVTERYGIVDLGTLNWLKAGTNAFYINTGLTPAAKATTADGMNMICAKYPYGGGAGTGSTGRDKVICYNWNSLGDIIIFDSDYSDAATFKTAMSGVYLVYELATPTTSTATPFTSPQIVDKDGTEEYVTTGVVPVGHETEYPTDLRDVLDKIAEVPTSDGTYTLKCTKSGTTVTMEWVADE